MEEQNLENQEKSIKEVSSTTYAAETDKIIKSSVSLEEKLNLLDMVIKDFLRKKFHIKKIDEYSDIIDFFLEKNKPHIATLCHEMIEALYSGDVIDTNKLNIIVDDFKGVLTSEQSSTEKSLQDPSFKSLISPITDAFSRIKNHKKEGHNNFNTHYVSKQIKKTVDSTILENDSISLGENSLKKAGKNLTLNRDILDNLSPMKAANPNLLNNTDDYYMIESIDDLGRIKNKIKLRRIMNVQ